MVNLKSKIEETGERIRDYYETVTEIKKLQAIDKATSAFSAAVAAIAVVLVFFFALVFASIMVAYLIGESSGHVYTGFLYVTGFYLLLGVLMVAFRDKLMRNPLRNILIKSIFKHEPKD